jgi:hypothetical protein
MLATTAVPTATDRRVAPRFRPAFGTICRLGPRRVGLVCNISVSGISMLVSDPPGPGAQMAGDLTLEGGGASMPVTLRVVHVRKVETGDFFMGAQFTSPLEPDQMKPFLTPPPREVWQLPKKG